jgi:hypothetical protein
MSDRDYLEEMHEEAELRFGKRLSPSEAAEKFALHGADHRIHHLKRLRAPESMTINEAAERHPYESALRAVHERMRRLGR